MSIHPTIRAWCYARETMRRIGFGVDDLFFVISGPGDAGHLVTLQVQAQGRTFNWTIGLCDLTRTEIDANYRAACDLWNSGSPEFSEAEFERSEGRLQVVHLVAALNAKGFVLP